MSSTLSTTTTNINTTQQTTIVSTLQSATVSSFQSSFFNSTVVILVFSAIVLLLISAITVSYCCFLRQPKENDSMELSDNPQTSGKKAKSTFLEEFFSPNAVYDILPTESDYVKGNISLDNSQESIYQIGNFEE